MQSKEEKKSDETREKSQSVGSVDSDLKLIPNKESSDYVRHELNKQKLEFQNMMEIQKQNFLAQMNQERVEHQQQIQQANQTCQLLNFWLFARCSLKSVIARSLVARLKISQPSFKQNASPC